MIWIALFIVIFLAVIAAGSVNRRTQWRQDHPIEWTAARSERRKTIAGALVIGAIFVAIINLGKSLPPPPPAADAAALRASRETDKAARTAGFANGVDRAAKPGMIDPKKLVETKAADVTKIQASDAVRLWDEQAAELSRESVRSPSKIAENPNRREKVAKTEAQKAGLTGVARSAFIGNVTEQCVRLKNDADVLWRTVCVCTATKLADQPTVAEAMVDNESSRRVEMIRKAGEQCVSEMVQFRGPGN